MKIRYIEPRPKGATIYEIANLPKLGLPLLAACIEREDPSVDQWVYCELIRDVEIDWDDVLSADLVCISTTTNTTLEGYAYADRIREAGIPVVIGGSHVTFMAHEALNHADYVIRREGHIGWVQLFEWITRGGARDELHAVLGLSWIDADGKQVDNPEAPPASSEDLDALPFPAFHLLEGRERMTTYPLMMKWGCPYDCNFCSVIKMFGRKLRSRSVENVMNELRLARAERVFFYDDIFIVDKKQSKALFRQMIAEKVTPMWTAQIRADSLYVSKKKLTPDYELLELMRDSGCYMVYVGFESVTQAGLDAYNKKQTVEHITTSIALLHEYGIRVHGMFVVGADTDTAETVRATIDFALEHEVDTLQMMMLTTLPGTAFDAQMRADDRVLTQDYSLYDGHHCIIAPKNMTPYELQMETWKGMLRFYSSKGWKQMMSRDVRRNMGSVLAMLVREWRTTVRLPKLALLSMRGRGPEAFRVMRENMSAKSMDLIYRLMGVPIFRRYGRNQLLKFTGQVDSMKHVDEIRKLPAWQPSGTEKKTLPVLTKQ